MEKLSLASGRYVFAQRFQQYRIIQFVRWLWLKNLSKRNVCNRQRGFYREPPDFLQRILIRYWWVAFRTIRCEGPDKDPWRQAGNRSDRSERDVPVEVVIHVSL